MTTLLATGLGATGLRLGRTSHLEVVVAFLSWSRCFGEDRPGVVGFAPEAAVLYLVTGSLQRALRLLSSGCALPGCISKLSLFQHTHNPAQVFSESLAKMYVALIKAGIFRTERKGCLLPSCCHIPFLLRAGGVSQLPALTGGRILLVHQELNWKPVPSLACLFILLNSTSCSHKAPGSLC